QSRLLPDALITEMCARQSTARKYQSSGVNRPRDELNELEAECVTIDRLMDLSTFACEAFQRGNP
ncbi:MAG: hypothetical protein KDB03_18685, partial [Planctomycetales bacterium]|nr:hypothetical protein [Planctomycetales bacterium]